MSRRKLSDSIDATFDFATSRPEFTLAELAEHLGASEETAKRAIQATRDMLADVGVNIVADPNGYREPWLYRLVSGHEGQKAWQANRMTDAERRVKTMHAIASSMVRAEDGRTKSGRKAARFNKFLGRLIEDLEEIESEFSAR